MKKLYRQIPKRLQFILATFMLLITASSAMAQDGYDPMSYSSLSQVFSSQQYLGSANSAILPSVAMENGYASFIDNPAAMSLIKGSYVNIGYMSNRSEFNQSFRGNELLLDSKADYINNIGVVYKIPTRVGSLVLGGGIHTNSVYNRSLGSSAFNNQSTITDIFKGESSDYRNIAFETYAIDYADQAQTQLESIFRIGFDDGFPGTYQQSELTQDGRSREFAFFMGTEFKKNLHIGFSLGINEAFHNMSRNILEEDLDNVYDGDFIEQDENGENGTDIYSIQLSDELRSDVLGFEARIGAVYKLGQYLNLGASWSLPSIMEITEEYNSTITTSFDNSIGPFFDSFEGEFTYAITRPSKYSLGMAVNQLKGFDLSIGVDFISYNKTDIDLTYDQSLDFDEVAFLRDQEAVIEQSISQRYQSVMNTRIGAQYRFKNGAELRAGTSILPSKSVQIDETRTLYSGGIGIPLSRDFFLDITTQYIQWNDRSVLYEYQDMGSTIPIQESISESNQLINVLIGIKIKI
jgi:long-subunit fatty acid transport protein